MPGRDWWTPRFLAIERPILRMRQVCFAVPVTRLAGAALLLRNAYTL